MLRQWFFGLSNETARTSRAIGRELGECGKHCTIAYVEMDSLFTDVWMPIKGSSVSVFSGFALAIVVFMAFFLRVLFGPFVEGNRICWLPAAVVVFLVLWKGWRVRSASLSP